MLKRYSFFKAFSIVVLITLISKLLGFVREAIVAAYFGTSVAADMFYVAFIIPTTAFTVIASTIQGRVLPLFIEQGKDSIKARQLLQSFNQLFIFVSIVMTLILILFMFPLLRMMAPGFSHAEVSDTVILALIMIPLLIIMTITTMTRVVYHAYESFAIPAYGILINNIAVILSIVLLFPFLDVYSLAIGVTIGGLIQLIYQYLLLPKNLLPFSKWKKDYFKSSLVMLKPMISIVVAAIALQLNVIVDRMVASFLHEGSIAALNYSYRLLWIPLSILLIPISTIFYPKLSNAYKKRIKDSYEQLYQNGLKVMLLLATPTMLVMIFESSTLVQVVFERGAFNENATQMTTGAFYFYTLGLIFFATREYFAQHFYITKDYQKIMIGSVVGVTINIIGSIILSMAIGVNGIALATSLSMLFQTFYYYYFITKTINTKNIQFITKNTIAIVILSIPLIYLQRYFTLFNGFFSLLSTSTIVFGIFYLIMNREIRNMVLSMKGK